MTFQLDSKAWAAEQFAGCDLGDKRRTRRLIQVAEQVANHPSGSFPQQMPEWSDLKATYRLFAEEDVTFAAITAPHYQQSRAVAPGCYLILGDTTEISFGYRREIEGLSEIGNGSDRGFLLHNGLLVEAETERLVGVAGQVIHYRQPAPKKENRGQRLKRKRESQVWGELINQIGEPPAGATFVHVLDRGGDNFEVYCALLRNRDEWVVRASALHRVMLSPDAEKTRLKDYLETLPVAGSYELYLRARPKQPARTAKLEVRFGSFSMPVPQQKSPLIKALKPASIAMNVVWVREVSPPKGGEPISWVLYTSAPVNDFDDAWRIITYYERRWLIEEYHKALKTGCGVQQRLLEHADRLEPMVGLMSVVAVRLLQLKSVARTEPDRPAASVVPPLWIRMLAAARKKLKRVHQLTVYQFYRELAKLGGFLGRKSDGEPGWITIWRGWQKLHTLIQGAQLVAELKKCG